MSDDVDRMPGWEIKEAVRELRVKLRATRAVLAERERELLTLKGPCSTDGCRLHYAHAGPCDVGHSTGAGRDGNGQTVTVVGWDQTRHCATAAEPC